MNDKKVNFVILNSIGESFNLDVNVNDTMHTTMLRIQNECSISFNQQAFICQEDNEPDQLYENCADVLAAKSEVAIIDDLKCIRKRQLPYFVVSVKDSVGKVYAVKGSLQFNTLQHVMLTIHNNYGIPFEHQHFTCFDQVTKQNEYFDRQCKQLLCKIKGIGDKTESLIQVLDAKKW